ncbi:PIN domain-containing protein [uncultured Sphingomonas sp.]|uniref:PIN domain-containing protein n=1 Tax=uncultured Sphingomonas sp. TaxID=158754 RepID=UPI003433CF20
MHTLAVEADHFVSAARIADRRDLGIRAGDALHLAIAAAAGFRLVTLDRTMAAAAPLLGVPLEPLD